MPASAVRLFPCQVKPSLRRWLGSTSRNGRSPPLLRKNPNGRSKRSAMCSRAKIQPRASELEMQLVK